MPSAIFERECIRTDVFTIQSTFLRDDEEAFDRVVEQRGRVGGVWSFSLVRSIKQGGGRGNFIDEARIGAAMYNELLNEADPERKSVRKKRTVFTCHVGVCGRDVTHRVEEVVAVEDAGPPRGPGPAAPASGKDGANGTPRKGSVANGNRENVELLTVDVPDGGVRAARLFEALRLARAGREAREGALLTARARERETAVDDVTRFYV